MDIGAYSVLPSVFNFVSVEYCTCFNLYKVESVSQSVSPSVSQSTNHSFIDVTPLSENNLPVYW